MLTLKLFPFLAVLILARPSHDSEAAPQVTALSPGPLEIVDAANEFALELLSATGKSDQNLACSPASTYLALLLAYAGAEGETASELARVLHLTDGSIGDREAALKAAQTLMRPVDETEGNPQLAIANSIWGQSGHPFRSDYLERAGEYLGAAVLSTDFLQDPQGAREAINSWVDSATRGHIPGLLKTDDVSSNTRAVLTNAVWFQAAWDNQFEVRDTRTNPFYCADGKAVSVPTLRGIHAERIMETEGFQMLELSYKRVNNEGARWSMLVLLPREGQSLAKLEETLSPEKLTAWSSRLEEKKVDISLPRFHTTSRFSLRAPLQQMGLKRLFDPTRCDLSGMDGGAGKLFCDEIIQQVDVSVSENGTVAAAATALVMKVGSRVNPPEPKVFNANRPFLYFLKDQASGQLMFCGRVARPAPAAGSAD